MIKLTLKDGSVREIEKAMPASEIIKGIGMGLYKAACCVKLDGEVFDMRTVVDHDCEFEVMTFDSKAGKETFWHTASHLMAQAVKNLYPEAKLARGPATETGYYYDFGVDKPFTQSDLDKIEAEMKKLAKEGYELERFELPASEAVKLMQDRGEDYKIELIHKHDDKGEKLSFYKQGDFVDLCAGPHIMNVSAIKATKLLSCTGAYWGDAADNKQLCRVYGVSFPKASMLDEHLKMLEEAKLRDHNKLGRELEYFTTVDYIGQGLPILLPKGSRVIQLLQRWVEDVEQARGCQLTKTPLFAKRDLYKISGHWDHYRDGMFIMGDPDDEEKDCFALRPMTCPFQYQVYLNRQRSYRDLPMRLTETSTLFRNEDSGEMHGLIRVRQFTISEGHFIIRPDQLEDEFKFCLDLAKYCLETVGLLENCTFRFSQWDPANPKNKYEGTAEQWEYAQAAMKTILDDLGLDYEIGIDEAAFYGPKLDIQYKNVYGKEDTLVTIQIDMLLAEKFGMYYVDKDGQKKLPYIIHRTSLGCYERTLAYMIEHFNGVMPLWLAPEQVRLLPIGEAHVEYARKLAEKMTARGMRVTVDADDINIGTKIKKSRLDRIPYMFIIGDKEVESNTLSVRSRKTGEESGVAADDMLARLYEEIDTKAK
ncbi:threonine--tRNA ligase [Ruminococcus sp. FC2018]|uniref:threonine--tRNA ligase n=1 Tax=Ruminococcus sp. FC2018 TaxID=1410617 RepID=UPI00048C1AD0|nr:threonine--tRNA ligase [Ruminococcus sp. FC2018]